ncbi:MAG TPA: D-2-hydroxyacid dehydrogenase [Gemmatimonadaceae bacterium]|nr:D-2-hydroxyacid dehydrogenase [Gemmatimonadaceae bacterium]
MKVLIFVSWPVKAWCIPDSHAAMLREQFPDVDFVQTNRREEVSGLIGDVDAAFSAFLTPEMVGDARRLRWVQSPASAVEGLLPLPVLAERKIVVTNSRGIQAIPMAEHVMGGLLVLARRFDRTLEAQREKRWIQNDLSEDGPWMLHGRRMTIVGLGTIGVEIARRANAFGMHVTGVRKHLDRETPPFVDRVVGPDHLDESLRGCDILVLSAPGVAATHHMIGAEQLALLNPGAIVVNVARGQIIDDEALRRGLETELLGGAVLDVFDREPLDASSPFWSLPNVVVTPHSSGFRTTHWDDVIALFGDNLRRFQRNEPLRNLVDLAAGY